MNISRIYPVIIYIYLTHKEHKNYNVSNNKTNKALRTSRTYVVDSFVYSEYDSLCLKSLKFILDIFCYDKLLSTKYG